MVKKAHVVKRADGSILIINYEEFSKLVSSSGEEQSASTSQNRTSQESSSGTSNSSNSQGVLVQSANSDSIEGARENHKNLF